MNKPFQTPGTSRPMKSEAVRFHNGMIVTDTDLTAAMNYSVQLLAATNRAVHGCGVACGFWFAPDPDLCGQTRPCDPCGEGEEAKRLAHPGFHIQVRPGSAFDCYGLPIELCEPVLVDLSPDTCGCDSRGGTVCIAVRRVSSDEAPRGDCCGDPSTQPACTRVRDHVEIRAFRADALPPHICGRDPGDGGNGREGCGCNEPDPIDSSAIPPSSAADPSSGPRDPYDSPRYELDPVCKCLMQCDPCECCGEGWVLLGCVELCETGIVVQDFAPGSPVYDGRKWIKSIECRCQPAPAAVTFHPSTAQSAVDIEELSKDLKKMGLDDRRSATLMVAGVNTVEEAIGYIEANPDRIKQAFGLKSDDLLKDYVRKGNAMLEKGRKA